MKEKKSGIVVSRLVLKTMSDEPTKAQILGGKAAFQRAEDSAFHLVAPKTWRLPCSCDHFCDKLWV
jgi:hypothetical protein